MDERVFAGKYRAVRELAADRTGRTWLATGPGGSEVVVKVIHPANADVAATIERDVSLVSGIRHPALPTVYEWGHDGPDFFVVREFVAGNDLKLEMSQQERFAPLTAARYGADAADALAQIHRRGIVHGNIKTANLIRMPQDAIKLVGNSLGMPAGARLAADDAPSAAHYLAPEQIDGAGTSPASDVYALGVVLYELVTGRVPFDGPTAAAVADQQVHMAPTPPSDIVPEVPAALEMVILKALEKEPEARYASAEELRVALDGVSEAQAPEGVSAAVTPERRRVSPWVWLLAAVLVAALGVGLAWAFGLFGSSESVVPDVVGRTVAEASSTIAAAGLQVGSVTFAGQPVTGIADGSVSAQTPAQGTEVDPATKVDLVLAGAEVVRVPDVVGQTETQATLALQNAGFVMGTISNVPTSGVAAGTVIAQGPLAGMKADKGASVDLQVAQAPSTPAVPDVTGQTRADARAALESVGFVVKVVERSDATVASGKVIDQSPTGGVTARAGSTVTVFVSTGPAQATVPDVVGSTQADAVNALTAAGFKATITLQTGGGPVGTVTDQSPAAGQKAASGSVVVITVAQ